MNNSENATVLLAAGGTGGHLFPAMALASELTRRGYSTDLATDFRAKRYEGDFPSKQIHIIASDTIRRRNPLSLAKTAYTLARGFFSSYRLLARLRPAVVVGFGGYPILPPILAASLRGIPICLHEQNAVMGRANRSMVKRATAIALSIPDTKFVDESLKSKIRVTGNPVRPAVVAAREIRFVTPKPNGKFRLLVFGGSQGARVFSDIVPGAIARLDTDLLHRLEIVQQCRNEDVDRVVAGYGALGVKAEVKAFYPDLPARIGRAHLVISRSGAGTVAELTAIGRPSILVPLPHAIDNDQLMNAAALARAGAAWVLPQPSMTAHRLADDLKARMEHPQELAKVAATARQIGQPEAAARLCDLVEEIITSAKGH